MKISELKQKLTEIEEEYGDLPVTVSYYEDIISAEVSEMSYFGKVKKVKVVCLGEE